MALSDPNVGDGLWIGKKYFGVDQETSFPFGVGLIVNGKQSEIIPEPAAKDE
jgi:branched-chain amino acid transport system substrate-binding protein